MIKKVCRFLSVTYDYLFLNKKEKQYKYLLRKGIDTQKSFVNIIGPLPIIIKHPKSIIKIENNVTLLSGSENNYAGVNHCVIFSTINNNAMIIIGEGTGISGASISCASNIIIGRDVAIGANVCIYDHDFHPINPYLRKYHNDNNIKTKPIIIEDSVWIGANSMILKGVHIGKGAVIGANSVVSSDVPDLCVYAGNPAKFIKKIEMSDAEYNALFK